MTWRRTRHYWSECMGGGGGQLLAEVLVALLVYIDTIEVVADRNVLEADAKLVE